MVTMLASRGCSYATTRWHQSRVVAGAAAACVRTPRTYSRAQPARTGRRHQQTPQRRVAAHAAAGEQHSQLPLAGPVHTIGAHAILQHTRTPLCKGRRKARTQAQAPARSLAPPGVESGGKAAGAASDPTVEEIM